ncbi:MAG: c-type cytochrome [bacterium]|nr:c-type cytochrome [bacterium]
MGRLRLAQGRRRVRGRLALVRRPAVGPPGAPCDDPYFAEQVMARVLVPVCAACHVAGGQAGGTALLVDPGDVAATQGRVATQVDAAEPAQSRLVLKPLAALPHGGGRALAAGGDEAAILLAWATRVAAGGCGAPPADAYTARCASCHGADGRGTTLGPNVRCAVHVEAPVRAGRGDMPAFSAAVLPAADLAAVEARLATWCDESGAARGADLFLANCAGCHGTTGAGGGDARGVAGPPIRCIGLATFLEQVPEGAGDMPAFPELSAPDVRLLHGHVRTFCPGG